jgi:putative ABC transport system ATP-binding protein
MNYESLYVFVNFMSLIVIYGYKSILYPQPVIVMTQSEPTQPDEAITPLFDYQSRTSKYIIEATNLCKTYQMGTVEVNAVRGVNLQVHRGEFLTILGVSGSGKSTLLHLLGALDQPTNGKVYVEGLDLSTLDHNKLADVRLRRVGFVFQFFNLMPQLTAQGNVELPLKFADVPLDKAHERALDLLTRVGLGERRDHVPSELSGGEQQRVAIARALANNPRIILADEPTGNLDTKTGAEIISLLRQLNRTAGLTIIAVGHDNRLTKVADRVVEMRDGEFIAERAGGGQEAIQ